MEATGLESRPTETHADAGTSIGMLDFDVTKEVELLHHDDAWQTGISRKRLVRFPDFRISLTAMKAGAKIELHQNPGRISVQTVDGRIRMHAADRTFDLPKGKVLVLDRAVPHDVEALDDSAFLLTIAQPEGTSARG
jgi:quercetin dioxygenase-like cupin family protein